MSHLYGFHPGTAVSKEETPEIFEAVKKTLDYRLANGGAGTGWSRAWLINFSARLMDSAMASEHIRLFFQRSIQDNIFDSHPPFQIDGNFGFTAGVAELLLQSHETGILRILPALPAGWHDGFVNGLKARSNMSVDISWKDNMPERVVIRPGSDQQVTLVYNDMEILANLHKGKTFEYIFGKK